MLARYPQRIVCLTEEITHVLYRLGEQHRIVGISGDTVHPPQARKEKPRVSAFTTAKIDKILALGPDHGGVGKSAAITHFLKWTR